LRKWLWKDWFLEKVLQKIKHNEYTIN
jgi:hypothetical protein